MLRFLKKVRKPKPSKTPVPPENATRQITSTGAEYGRDAEGERRSRQISTYKADGTDSTMTPDTGHGKGSRIANQDERIEVQQLPAPDALTLTPAHGGGDASECDLSWILGPTLILCPGSTARTGANTWGLCGGAKRATRSQHPLPPLR